MCYNRYETVIQPKNIGGIEVTIVLTIGLVSLSSLLLILISRLTVSCDNKLIQIDVKSVYFLIQMSRKSETYTAT